MAIIPASEYPGKIATDVNYPDGKAQNVTSPGDGTGTPWDAKLVNDIFGFQQRLTSLAGITPSGTPDNAASSQYFEAIWKLLNIRSVTVNAPSNDDITLTETQQLFNRVIITDTGNVLTGFKSVFVGGTGRVLFVKNETNTTLFFSATGTQARVDKGRSAVVFCDGTNVYNLFELLGGPATQDGIEYLDPGMVGTPFPILSPTGAKIYPDGTIRGMSLNGEYIKYPNGIIECWNRILLVNSFQNVNLIEGTWIYPHPTSTSDNIVMITELTYGPDMSVLSPVRIYLDDVGTNLLRVKVHSQGGHLEDGYLYLVSVMLRGRWA